MFFEKMTTIERRAVISLSAIMGMRMIGLFMVLPVFALYAHQLDNSTPLLIGVAMGIYGLTQALFQIPFGALSDRFGRKPIIVIGLLLFALGSLIAALAHSLEWLIVGRALQGASAVGSTILAMMADLTREEQRTKSMAIIGITIGFSFSLAMLLGPLLTQWLAVNDLFYLAMLFSLGALIVLYTLVPTPIHQRWHRDTEPELKSIFKLILNKDLAKLNSGIFILHAIFTASFIVIPISLYQFAKLPTHQQWLVYLPTLLGAFIISLICIGLAEKKQRLKFYFIISILNLASAEILLWVAPSSQFISALGLCLFFTGFSTLEAFLPSLISRTAPAVRKGSALGIFSCSQFLGIFVGGVFGGWLYGQFSFSGVYFFCITMTGFWLALAFFMQPPRHLITQILRLLPAHEGDIISKLRLIPGVVEISYIADDGTAYLKMEHEAIHHPDYIQLKKQLQNITQSF